MLAGAWSQDLYWQDGAAAPDVAGSGSWAVGVPGWNVSPTSGGAPGPWVDGNAAHFVGSNGGTVTLGSAITATNINFDPPASTFTINTNGNALTIEGTGIVNNSRQTQTITNSGSAAVGGSGGFTQFTDSSNARTATITNNGSAAAGGNGGETDFSDNSSAGAATIITKGGTGSGVGAQTLFINAGDGGSARAIANENGSFDISGLTKLLREDWPLAQANPFCRQHLTARNG